MKKITWEEYFLAIVKVTALRSKDPNTRVGAILVNKRNRIIGTGYNGMPKGDDTFPWAGEGEEKNTKYPYVIHAEVNALLNAIQSIEGSCAYVTLFPCSNCAKLLAHAGVSEIIYINDKYNGTGDNKIAKSIFNKLDVKYKKGIEIKVEIN